jgi:hypothetical protein
MSNKIIITIMAVVIMVLLGIVGYLLINKSNSSSEINKAQYSQDRNISVNKNKYFIDKKPYESIAIKDLNGKEIYRFEGLDAVGNVEGITNDNKFFYKCNEDGNSQSFLDVYSLPDMKLVFQNPFKNELLVECGQYNQEKNSIVFFTSPDWNSTKVKHEYYFDKKQLKNEEQPIVKQNGVNNIEDTGKFEDVNFGIKFEYPSGYKIGNMGHSTKIIRKPGNSMKVDTIEIVKQNGKKMDFKIIITKSKENIIIPDNTRSDNDKLEDKLIGDIKYKKFKLTGMGEAYGYFVKNNGYYYTFETVFAPKGSKEAQIFEDIMKTVRFIE